MVHSWEALQPVLLTSSATLLYSYSFSSDMEGKRLEYRGEEALKELEKFTAKADEVQENILKEIIARNCETEYLKKYMGGSKDVLEFKQSVPVITYKDIHPYIQRIANGEDSSLISGHPITEMLCRFLSLFSSPLLHLCLLSRFEYF